MRYNNVLYLLMGWCEKCSAKHRKAYQNGSEPMGYIPYRTADELRFKLSSLLEQDFSGYEAFKARIMDLLDVCYDRFLQNLQNKAQKYMMERVQREFLNYFDTLGPDSQGDAPAYYERVILAEEAERIIERFEAEWDYTPNTYWYPLSKCGKGEMLFLMQELVESREGELLKLLELPQQRMYCYGERNYSIRYVTETDDLLFYSGLEGAYTDKDFTWLIYCSHEQTVTFAGVIVPRVKELYAAEKAQWNRFEWAAE